MLDMAGGVVLGAAVVPVLVGVAVVVLGVFAVGVAGATEPAVPVVMVPVGEVGAVSVPVPAVSEPHPNNASAMSAQAVTLRRGMALFVWPLTVEFNISKFMSSLQGPAMPQVID